MPVITEKTPGTFFKKPYFCGLFVHALPDSIKVVRQILILFVEVRILVGQL
jgi:hypothetical protein